MKARAAIQESSLGTVEQKKFQEGTRWHAIKKFLLMETALIPVFGKESLRHAELLVGRPILQDLACLQRAVGIMTLHPMGHPFAEGIMVQESVQICHRTLRNRDWVYYPFVTHFFRTKHSDVIGRIYRVL